MSRTGLTVAFCAMTVVMALAIVNVCSTDNASREIGGDLARRHEFASKLAEGLSLRRHGCYGVDFIRCGSCRMEKRKLGGLTLGCFNVLCLDDLSIVIPDELRTRDSGDVALDTNGVSAVELARGLGLGGDFLKVRGQMPSFSGLRVTKLAVSTLDAGSNAVLRCVAACGEAKRDGLHLEGCSVIDGLLTNFVGTALLAVKPKLKVIWRDGEMNF